jgi:alpha,alpha-trehalase
VAELLWDCKENMWFDFDMLNGKRRHFFYASNLFPLWTEAYPERLQHDVGKCAVAYLLRTGAVSHKGGIPASLQHTGQQWDWNAWPPLQHVIVSGLNKTKYKPAQELAFQIARNYTLTTITSCHKGDPCQIFEKYDPLIVGAAGGGGEYEVQLGFGWTNGVLIDFINTYGDCLVTDDKYDPKPLGSKSGFKGKDVFEKKFEDQSKNNTESKDEPAEQVAPTSDQAIHAELQ